MRKQYYAVYRGRNTGIYDNWPEAKLQVNGFNGAECAGFPNWESARDAYLSFFDLNDLPTTIHLPAQFRPNNHVNRDMVDELEQTRNELEQTQRELDDTRRELAITRRELVVTRRELAITQRELDLITRFGNVNLY